MENFKTPKITTERLVQDADIKINEVDALYGKVIESATKLPKEGYLSEIDNHKNDVYFEEEMDNLFIELHNMQKKLAEFQSNLEQLHNEKSTTENDNFIKIQNKIINDLTGKIDMKEKEIDIRREKHEKDFEKKMEDMTKYN